MLLERMMRHQSLFLPFAGRALQHYHADSTIRGKRIERIRISSLLSKIIVSCVRSSIPIQHRATGTIMHTAQIIDLGFQYSNGESVEIGTPHPKAKLQWPMALENESCLCRRQFDASSFAGFCVRYDEDGIISALGVLPCGKEAHMPVAGSDFLSHLFEMRMERVVEVVFTFQGVALADIGIRGHRCKKPTMFG
ncbi:hypothetical protein BJY01DRAFT_255156 [Aspergillus pseudoustus]|uniref:Uncharacterized protein n=1 Tax=Aspergillus pseudoustus TaxID=1810923 RepID=A0ABR4IP87_9EURO